MGWLYYGRVPGNIRAEIARLCESQTTEPSMRAIGDIIEATVDEIARAALFLASDASSFMTGTAMLVVGCALWWLGVGIRGLAAWWLGFLVLTIAASYGGRWDITQACRSLAEDVAAGRLAPADISESLLDERISLAGLPPPDLFIRTGGDLRISNFLLWQLAYTELWFTETLWPDLDRTVLDAALADFADRERRFGLTSAQVAGSNA